MSKESLAYKSILVWGKEQINDGVSPFIFIRNLTKGNCPVKVGLEYYCITQEDQYHLMDAWIKMESKRISKALFA